MSRISKLVVLATVLTVVLGAIPAATAADDINPPGDWTEGFDISDNDASETNLSTGLIDYDEENETILFRTTLTNSTGLNGDNAVLIYIDEDQDADTGINRDTVTDGEAGSAYYDNLDDIGADYVVSAGGSLGNSTYEWDDTTWNPVTTNRVNDTGSNVTIEIDESDINSPDQFDLKFAYLEGDTSNPDAYDWAPNPSNDRIESVTFDTTIDGIPDQEPEAIVSGEINATNTIPNNLSVEVRLTDDTGAEVDASAKTFLITDQGESGAETYNFRGLDPANFNGDGATIEAKITNESTDFRITPKDPQPVEDLSDGSFVEQDFELTKDVPPISLTVEPESGYFEPGETFNAKINLTNNEDINVSQVDHTLKYDKSKIVINETNSSESILERGDGRTFDPEKTNAGLQTVIGTLSENGTAKNGTLYGVEFKVTDDATNYQVQDTVTISQSTTQLLNDTESGFSSETVAKGTNITLNQTETDISGISAEIATKGGNMVNSTMIVTASVETDNAGAFENITIKNTTSGSPRDTVACGADVDCKEGVELNFTLKPGEDTFINQTRNTYANQKFTVIAYGNDTNGGDPSESTIVSDRILKEGDVTPAIKDAEVDEVGNVTRDDVVDMVNSEYFRNDVGDATEWSDLEALIYDTNNDGVVDLEDVLTVVRASY
jgi:hypothetical protein